MTPDTERPTEQQNDDPYFVCVVVARSAESRSTVQALSVNFSPGSSRASSGAVDGRRRSNRRRDKTSMRQQRRWLLRV